MDQAGYKSDLITFQFLSLLLRLLLLTFFISLPLSSKSVFA